MAHSPCLSRDSRHSYSVGLLIRLSSHDCSCPLAPRKSFDILALYKSDYYYSIIIMGTPLPIGFMRSPEGSGAILPTRKWCSYLFVDVSECLMAQFLEMHDGRKWRCCDLSTACLRECTQRRLGVDQRLVKRRLDWRESTADHLLICTTGKYTGVTGFL